MIIPIVVPVLGGRYVTGPSKSGFQRWLTGFLKEQRYSSVSHVTFDYYGGRWRIDCFVGVALYWIHSSGELLEYKADWNHWRNDKRSVLYIMRNHPNLNDRRHQLKLDGKLNDRPMVIKKGA